MFLHTGQEWKVFLEKTEQKKHPHQKILNKIYEEQNGSDSRPGC